MKHNTINDQPIMVDFNSIEVDGAVRLFMPLKTLNEKKLDLKLKDGQNIWLSDGEIEMIGTILFRNKIWVAIPNKEGFLNVDPNVPHHFSKL